MVIVYLVLCQCEILYRQSETIENPISVLRYSTPLLVTLKTGKDLNHPQ